MTVTRRTVAKGAAWAVPALMVSAAAPAAAASQGVTITSLGIACKLPGASCQREVGVTKGYAITTQICITVKGTVTIDFGTAVGTLCGAGKSWSLGPDPLTIPGSPSGTQVCGTVVLGLQGEPDSRNCAISGSAPFTWTSTNGLSGSGTLTFSAPSTPPCKNCAPPADARMAAPASTSSTSSTTSSSTTSTSSSSTSSSTSSSSSSSRSTTSEAPSPTTEAARKVAPSTSEAPAPAATPEVARKVAPSSSTTAPTSTSTTSTSTAG